MAGLGGRTGGSLRVSGGIPAIGRLVPTVASTGLPHGAFQFLLHVLRPCEFLFLLHLEGLDVFAQDLLDELERVLDHVLACEYD